MGIQSLLGNSYCLPLLHMAKSYIWLEETNKRINEFSIGYMINPNLSMNKDFRQQVKLCMRTKFSTSTMTHTSKILLKPNTRVLALVIFFENRKKCKENVQSIKLCNIYNYKKLCCIDYLGYEKTKLSDLPLGGAGSYKHIDKKYDNILGFGIPDLLMNLLFCQGLLKNNESVVILKFPNMMFECYFNKEFITIDCNENNLKRLPSEVKDRVSSEVTVNSEKVMICYTTIPSTSNTLKNFLVNANSHSSYTNK